MMIQWYTDDMVMNIAMVLFFGVFVMIVTSVLVWLRSVLVRQTPIKSFSPDISVIIPMKNEERHVDRCLRSVYASRYAGNMQVICVNDRSTDSTQQLLEKWHASHGCTIHSVKENGKSGALNAGIRASLHDIVVTIDADCVLPSDFLKHLVAPFQKKKIGATNGLIQMHKPTSLLDHFQAIEMHMNNLIRQSFSRVFGNGIWFFGAAAAFRKHLLMKSGGFATDVLTEDMDMSLTICEQGYCVETAPDAVYATDSCKTLTHLLAQRMRWFYGGIQSTWKHKQLLFKQSFATTYLICSQLFWSVYSFVILPIIVYQVFYWLPPVTTEIPGYLFRWFTLVGPLYVVYKIPEWGVSLLNIFGVASGIVTAFLLILSITQARTRIQLMHVLAIFFYFPYTIFLNICVIAGVVYYSRKRGVSFTS